MSYVVTLGIRINKAIFMPTFCLVVRTSTEQVVGITFDHARYVPSCNEHPSVPLGPITLSYTISIANENGTFKFPSVILV